MNSPETEQASGAGESAAGAARSEQGSLTLPANAHWYVVQTLHHREIAAAHHIEKQSFRVFLPTIRKTVRHARKLREVRAPLFPGYLFAGFDPDRDRWRSINGTFGVARLITAGERPVPVPQGVVEAFLANVDHEGVVRLDGGLRIGESVKVLLGPFAGSIGSLDRLDARGRVQILLQIMGAVVRIDIDRNALARA